MGKNDDKLKELLERVNQGTKEVFESDRYRNYLATMSKFHFYSFRNSLLIHMQKPEASYVAGYAAWQKKFNRQVQRGENGIQIVGYAPGKVNAEQEKKDNSGKPILGADGQPMKETVTRQIPSYTPVSVYDVSQTEGGPLPQLINELNESAEAYQNLMQAIREVSPFQISIEDIKGAAKGFCDPMAQKIVIQLGMSEAQSVKTAIHEVTHADLYAPEVNLSLNNRTDRRTREVEAESTAFVVCSHYGIDTSDYTFPYLASWSSTKELKELQNSLDTIQKQAGELIDKIDTRFVDLQKNKEKEFFPEITPDQYADTESVAPAGRTFTLYQLKHNNLTHDLKFEGLDYIKQHNNGLVPTLNMYNQVYAGTLPEGKGLDDIFTEFNINHPADFTGHSLSVSDLIVIEYQGSLTVNCVNRFGFENVPELAAEIKAQREQQQPEKCNNQDQEAGYVTGTAVEEARRSAETLDSVKFDGDIDLDREKTRKQLGFRNKEEPQPTAEHPKNRMSMKDRFAAAQAEADRRNSPHAAEQPQHGRDNERGNL